MTSRLNRISMPLLLALSVVAGPAAAEDQLRILTKKGSYEDVRDALKDAVKKYQESNGLSATGGINAATLGKMGIALTDKQKDQVAAQAAYDAAKAPKN